MLLYEKSLDYKELKIFECTPDKQKLYKFKKEETFKIPEDDRIYKAISLYANLLFFERNTHGFNSYGTEYITSYEHRLIKYPIDEEELERQRKVLETYYQINKGMRSYFLEGWKGYNNKVVYFTPLGNYVDKNYAYVIENVIQITKSLFYLEMLLLGEYNMVSDEDLQKYIAMLNFEIKLCKRYNLEDLRELQKYNLLCDPLDNIINPKIKNSKRVLDLIRKK